MTRALLLAAKAEAERRLLAQTADCELSGCAAADGGLCHSFNLAAANFASAAKALDACPPAKPAGGVLVWRDEDGDEAWAVTHPDGRVALYTSGDVWLPDHIWQPLMDAAPTLTAEPDLAREDRIVQLRGLIDAEMHADRLDRDLIADLRRQLAEAEAES